ncbi:MAG: hypothetical protein Q9225_004376 [Loekoesia sp. 1 TL-2023]
MDKIDLIFAESDAEIEANCARIAREKGYASWKEYDEALDRQEEARWQARAKRLKEERERRGEERIITVNPQVLIEPEPEPWYLPERCRCTEHMVGDFCEGNLKSPPCSMDGRSEWYRARQPRLEEIDINEWGPSRRLSDVDLHRMWSQDLEDEYQPQYFPLWAKRDELTKFLQRQPGAPERMDQNLVGSGVQDANFQPQPTGHINLNMPSRHHSPEPSSKRKAKEQRAGKGAIKQQGSKSVPSRLPSQIMDRAPSIKKTKAKNKKENVTPPWLRTFLEQPRQTRSQDSKILFELDAQSQVVTAQPRRSQRKVRSW